MKTILAVLILTLTGCSTYQTHLRTGCITTCDRWKDDQPIGIGSTSNTQYQSAHTYNLPNASYMAIRSGSTTTIIQTSKSK